MPDIRGVEKRVVQIKNQQLFSFSWLVDEVDFDLAELQHCRYKSELGTLNDWGKCRTVK